MEQSSRPATDTVMQAPPATAEAARFPLGNETPTNGAELVVRYKDRLHPQTAQVLELAGSKYDGVMQEMHNPSMKQKENLVRETTKKGDTAVEGLGRKYGKNSSERSRRLHKEHPTLDPLVDEAAATLLSALHIEGGSVLVTMLNDPAKVAKELTVQAAEQLQAHYARQADSTVAHLLEQSRGAVAKNVERLVEEGLKKGGQEGAAMLQAAMSEASISIESIIANRQQTKRSLGKIMLGRSKPDSYPDEPEPDVHRALDRLGYVIQGRPQAHRDIVARRYVEELLEDNTRMTDQAIAEALTVIGKTHENNITALGTNKQLENALIENLQKFGYKVTRRAGQAGASSSSSEQSTTQPKGANILGFDDATVSAVQKRISELQTEGISGDAALKKLLTENHPDRNPNPAAAEMYKYAQRLRDVSK